MDFHVSLEGRGDLAVRIYRGVLEAILDRRLRPGERLPPTREMARRLDVSRNTVTVAYERLVAEGFLVARVGSGTFVSVRSVETVRPMRARRGGNVHARRLWDSIPDAPEDHGNAPAYDFSVGIPDVRLFPLASWRQLVGRALRSDRVAAGYGEPAGYPALRAAIARHVGITRSVRAEAGDVIVTQGAQQALDIIGRILIEPGRWVAVEEPGYPPARLLFQSLGARVVGVPVDAEGLDVAAIPEAAHLVYVTPSHQFPLGIPMSPGRRASLLAWAERRDSVIVEDDYDSEFRFEDRPLEPLQNLDRSGRVVYVGSFSKTLLPMLRLGFLIAPASLRGALLKAKRLTDWHGEQPSQAALAQLIDGGLMARHLRRATLQYAARHERIVTTLQRDFRTWLQLVPSTAGLHVCARQAMGAPIDLDRVVRRARQSGVRVESLAAYCAEPPTQPGLVIGYGAIRTEDIEDGLRRLAEAFQAEVLTA
jgi:GntR family transcriptional regulator / MocR family aminotransferase